MSSAKHHQNHASRHLLSLAFLATLVCASSDRAVALTISGPTYSWNFYTLSWQSIDEVELQERPINGTFTNIYRGFDSSRSFTKASDGAFEYRARRCIPPEPGVDRFSALRAAG